MTRNVKYQKIKKAIRKGKTDLALELLEEYNNMFKQKTEAYLRILEEKNNKEVVEIGQRFLEIVTVESSTHKLTVNAATGRFTLKLSSGASLQVKKEIVDFVKAKIMVNTDLPNVTLRGKIKWNKDCYQWYGQSESKRQKRYFESIED